MDKLMVFLPVLLVPVLFGFIWIILLNSAYKDIGLIESFWQFIKGKM